MSRAHCLAAMVTIIVVLLSLEVEAGSTADDVLSRRSSTLEEGVTIFRAVVKLLNRASNDTATPTDVKQIKQDLAEIKHLLGSRQQPFSPVDSSNPCEYKTHSILIVMCVQWRW